MEPLLPGLDVSRETMDSLRNLEAEVRKWTPKINLISRPSLYHLWTRHIVDSAQVFLAAPNGQRWLDIGSGGGFPALPVAILARDQRPDLTVTMMESDQRKCAFLRTIIRQENLNATVICDRIEQADPFDADILSARALADLTTLLSFCDRHLHPHGTALLQKGESWEKEAEAAGYEWRFEQEVLTSLTEPRAVLMKIRNFSRV